MKINGCNGGVVFWCPACKRRHVAPAGWTFNGNYERPTIHPSLVLTLNKRGTPEYNPELPTEVCHVIVSEGQLRYDNDSTHELSGKTVPMVDIPSD